MKVLQVVHAFNYGGAETLVKDYLLNFQRKGIKCSALCFERCGSSLEQELIRSGIQLYFVSDRVPGFIRNSCWALYPFRYVYIVFCFKKYLCKYKPDVIHTHLGVNQYVFKGIKKLRRVKKVSLFHTVHNEPQKLWLDKEKKFFSKISRRREYHVTRTLVDRYGMRLIALHDDMRTELNRMFHIDSTIVVNNGINFDRFDTLKDRHLVRKELGIPQSAFVVGHVGRLEDQKNHRKILEVFDLIHSKDKKAFLLLIGNGSKRKKIEEYIERRNLTECTLILSDRSDVPDLMNSMDRFIFPSLFEGLGIVLIEAQKVGIPCVISKNVPQHAVVSNLVKVLDNDDSNEKWAEALQGDFPEVIEYNKISEWDMNNVADRLIDLYKGRL